MAIFERERVLSPVGGALTLLQSLRREVTLAYGLLVRPPYINRRCIPKSSVLSLHRNDRGA
jgi:hypothetical protein